MIEKGNRPNPDMVFIFALGCSVYEGQPVTITSHKAIRNGKKTDSDCGPNAKIVLIRDKGVAVDAYSQCINCEFSLGK